MAHYAKKDEIITAVNEWHPYRVLENEISYDRLNHVFSLIKDNEVDHLRAMIEGSAVSGIAHLKFSYVDYDEDVINLTDDQRITVSQINPILLAARYKSYACLSYLIETFGLRQAMGEGYYQVREEQTRGDYVFKNLLLPILLKTEDLQSLDLVLRQDGFVLTKQDFNSFVSVAVIHRWFTGLKTFLSSNVAHFFFTTMTANEQRVFVERVVKLTNTLDAKNKKIFAASILEGVFTHRPYARDLVVVMLEQHSIKDVDFAKLARECLKNLTSEDLYHLYLNDNENLANYERQYVNISGNNFENEIAKILLRYRNEGKPDI